MSADPHSLADALSRSVRLTGHNPSASIPFSISPIGTMTPALQNFQHMVGEGQVKAPSIAEVCSAKVDTSFRRTKIICTIGPKTQSKEMLGQLLDAGMNCARLNFSHGSHDFHLTTITNLRAHLQETRRICAIMLDTKGPEIRTGSLQGGREVSLKIGQDFFLTTDMSYIGDEKGVAVTYKGLPTTVVAGDDVMLDDGLIQLRVTKIETERIHTRVINDGVLGEKKGVNLPGRKVDLPALTEQDMKDIKFGVENGIDAIAASFVRRASDVAAIREALGVQGQSVMVISKIENQEGLENFDDILEVSDGIMVARGDLGIEIPIEKVFIAQKMMINKCNLAGKPVITATQMLESMIVNPRPTRAEAGDVANAVVDGSDCVMLSGETAKGAYPREAVRMMSRVCCEAELAIESVDIFNSIRAMMRGKTISVGEAVSSSAVKTAFDLRATVLIVLTETGRSARHVSKYRPACPIIVITANEQTARQSMLCRGHFPLIVGSMVGTDSLIAKAIDTARGIKMCKQGDLVVVASGVREGVSGSTNVLKVLTVSK